MRFALQTTFPNGSQGGKKGPQHLVVILVKCRLDLLPAHKLDSSTVRQHRYQQKQSLSMTKENDNVESVTDSVMTSNSFFDQKFASTILCNLSLCGL